jgi:hypothetical protein
LHGSRYALRIMLHPLEPYVDREEFFTRLTRELLDISVLVMAYTPFDYVLRTAVDTSIKENWLDNSWRGLFLNGEFNLNRPDVLADDIPVNEVRACA